MKVLMLGRYALKKSRGGDLIQIENTAEELKKRGVSVDIVTDLNFDPSRYDLCHIFQLDWTPESFFYAKKIKKAGKPLVLSPIHHNVMEVKRFDDQYTFDFRRISKTLFKDQFARDVFKNIYRSVFEPSYMKFTLFSIFYGFKRMLKETMEMSDVVLVQTELEAKDLTETFGVNINWVKIPNGVSENFLNAVYFSNPFNFENYIISVGRIEPRKNQLNIINAVDMLRKETKQDIKLVLVGAQNTAKHFEYNLKFRNELNNKSWIKHIQNVPYGEMPSYYKYAKVCVSASWFETTGLTSLEAIVCGTNAVAAGDRAAEYLGTYASYCDPAQAASIKDAIKKEYFADRPKLPQIMKEKYTWRNAADLTHEVYKSLQNSNKHV